MADRRWSVLIARSRPAFVMVWSRGRANVLRPGQRRSRRAGCVGATESSPHVTPFTLRQFGCSANGSQTSRATRRRFRASTAARKYARPCRNNHAQTSHPPASLAEARPSVEGRRPAAACRSPPSGAEPFRAARNSRGLAGRATSSYVRNSSGLREPPSARTWPPGRHRRRRRRRARAGRGRAPCGSPGRTAGIPRASSELRPGPEQARSSPA